MKPICENSIVDLIRLSQCSWSNNAVPNNRLFSPDHEFIVGRKFLRVTLEKIVGACAQSDCRYIIAQRLSDGFDAGVPLPDRLSRPLLDPPVVRCLFIIIYWQLVYVRW